MTAAAFAGPIWARPVVVHLETWPTGSSGGGAPPWQARVARGWPVAPPTAKTRLVEKRFKTTQFGSTGFGEFSKGLELKMSVLGLGFYLVCKTMFI